MRNCICRTLNPKIEVRNLRSKSPDCNIFARPKFSQPLDLDRTAGHQTDSRRDVLLGVCLGLDLAKKYDWKDVCQAINAYCQNHAFNEQAVLLELQGASVINPTPSLDLSSYTQLQLSGNGTRDLAYYDSIIAENTQCQEDTALSDASVGESVSTELARSVTNDISQNEQQVGQAGIATILPGARITSTMLEAASHALGVFAISASRQCG